jgi:hypothetical protein
MIEITNTKGIERKISHDPFMKVDGCPCLQTMIFGYIQPYDSK